MSDKPMIESPISAEELLAQKDCIIKDLREKLIDFEMDQAIKKASQTVRRRSSAFRNSIKAEDSDVEIDSDEDSDEGDHFKAGEVGGDTQPALGALSAEAKTGHHFIKNKHGPIFCAE